MDLAFIFYYFLLTEIIQKTIAIIIIILFILAFHCPQNIFIWSSRKLEWMENTTVMIISIL